MAAKLIAVSTSVNNEMWVKLSFRVQGACNFLDFLDLFSEHLLLRFDRVQAPVDAAGQAVELLLWEPPFFSSKFRWIESRTSPKASAIRKPGGSSGPP